MSIYAYGGSEKDAKTPRIGARGVCELLLTTKLFPDSQIIFFEYFIFIIRVWVFFLHVCLFMQCTQRREDGDRYCGPGVEDGG